MKYVIQPIAPDDIIDNNHFRILESPDPNYIYDLEDLVYFTDPPVGTQVFAYYRVIPVEKE